MSNGRRKYKSEEKVKILKQHLVEKKPVSELCEQNGLHPNVFYRWQQEFFENGVAAFERKTVRPETRYTKKMEELEAKLARKNDVLAELMEAHVALKKSLGEI